MNWLVAPALATVIAFVQIAAVVASVQINWALQLAPGFARLRKLKPLGSTYNVIAVYRVLEDVGQVFGRSSIALVGLPVYKHIDGLSS